MNSPTLFGIKNGGIHIIMINLKVYGSLVSVLTGLSHSKKTSVD